MKNDYLNNQTVTGRQLICVMIMFMLGSSVVLGVSTAAGQDSWITVLIAVAVMIPFVIMYARIAKLFPQKGLFDIFELVFGKIIGKLITFLYIFYALDLAAMVLRDFAEFAQITSLTATPKIYMMLLMLGTVAYLTSKGIESFGRGNMLPFIIVTVSILTTLIMSFGKMDLNNFLPMFEHSFSDFAQGTFNVVSFPFAETILLLPLFDSLKKKESPYKIYLYGLLLGSLILLVIMVRNIGILGSHMMRDSIFPSFRASRLLTISNVLERFEAIVSYNFVFTGIVKIAVCIFAASKGITKLFGLGNYKQVLFPVCFLTLALGTIVFRDPTEIITFYNVSPYFFAIFQLIIPIMLWVSSEIKTRRGKNRIQA